MPPELNCPQGDLIKRLSVDQGAAAGEAALWPETAGEFGPIERHSKMGDLLASLPALEAASEKLYLSQVRQ